MNFRDIIHENRKTIIIGTTLTIFLMIVMIALIIVNYILDARDKYVADTNTSQASAIESNLDLSQYLDELHSVINQEYGERMTGYQIAEGELLGDGSWYVTTISQPKKSQWSLATDVYRIILHKESDKWQIAVNPSPILSYVDYPDIPREVIYSANNL